MLSPATVCKSSRRISVCLIILHLVYERERETECACAGACVRSCVRMRWMCDATDGSSPLMLSFF